MNFVSYAFLLLLGVVLLARFTIGARTREPAYLAVLLIASVVFYGWHVPSYVLILVTSTVVDYVAALVMGATDDGSRPARRRRSLALIASLVTNLGLLGVFKYADFGIESVRGVLSAIGIESSLPTLGLVLPMGISFYTFQSMSYTIDVYRGRLRPVRSFARFFLFVSFFPQLVAGPIVRATEFLPQLERPRRVHPRVVTEGLYLIVLGFFLKLVCADNLATYVDQHWSAGYEPGRSSVMLIWVTLLFSGQIFSDFAGYTAIARGVGYLLGFRLPLNFNSPYVAGTFKNFWERWHMTLSRWLRDYLYIPLGGNRLSDRRTMVNLMVVMVLGGLWHGAAFTFLAWGTLHGVALAIERMLGLQDSRRPRSLPLRLGWFVVVQVTVLVTWIFFRSETIEGALQFLRNIAAWNDGPYPAELVWMGLVFVLPIAVLHIWTVLVERRAVRPLGPWSKAALTGAMLFGIMTGYGGSNAFIYFQF
jgi:alginate O-acetyltransferase complex protein AlgI